MRQFELRRTVFGKNIVAQVLVLDEGVHVSVFGGQRPHIGAVSVVDPAGACSTTQFPGHKEGVVSERWAQALSQAGFRPVVAEAGIHYDNLSKAGIPVVLETADVLLNAVLDALSDAKTPL